MFNLYVTDVNLVVAMEELCAHNVKVMAPFAASSNWLLICKFKASFILYYPFITQCILYLHIISVNYWRVTFFQILF